MTGDRAIAPLRDALADRYRLERELGQGGMATVYLAHDIRHARDVAIKVLKPELGAVLGLERFQAEIRVTANLQHPNLLPLFDSGEAAGQLFYVMPYVDGETLRARLSREKQLPVDEAVRIAVAIANALDYAHARGVIHRDLKPENILLQAGQPVIADFGIALAVSNAGGARVTQTGLSLGTPQYMSPEQATGDRAIDARSDIYSLGAVTYEMLVGDPPHVASTAQAVVAKVLTERAPSVLAQRPSAGEAVAQAVARALEKLPADRWTSAGAFAEALQGRGASGARPSTVPAGSGGTRPMVHLAWGAALAVAVLGGVAAWRWRPALPEAPVTRFMLTPPEGQEFAYSLSGSVISIAISPDGRSLVFPARGSAGQRFYLRTTDALAPRPLPGGGPFPAFSPDGRSIAYSSLDGTALMRLPLDGSSPTKVCDLTVTGVAGITWVGNDELVFASGNSMRDSVVGLYRVPAAGGVPRRFTASAANGSPYVMRHPRPLDDGEHLLVSVARNRQVNTTLGLVSLKDGRTREIEVPGMLMAVGTAFGHLLFVRSDGALMAAPLNARRATVGAAVQVADSVAIGDIAGTLQAGVAFSASGTLLLARRGFDRELVKVNAAGEATPLGGRFGGFGHPRLSPDATRLAYDLATVDRSDIWIATLAGDVHERLTQAGRNDRPEWTPDGKSVLFTTSTEDAQAMLQPADGSAPARGISEVVGVREVLMTPDGTALILRRDNSRTGRDIVRQALTGERTVTPLVATNADEKMPRLSPDGRWLVYVSDESGVEGVYLRSAEPGGGRVAISSGYGSEPVWSRDGRRIFYRTGSALMAADVRMAPAPEVIRRERLFDAPYSIDAFHASYDVFPDGRNFVMIRARGEGRQLVVTQHWDVELRRALGLAR